MVVNILECAGCNVKYRVRGAKAGKTYKCPKCTQPLTEPEPKRAQAGQDTLDHDPGREGAKSKDKLVGTVIDQYRMIDMIGRGGMGTVYKAEHMALGRVCALKLLSPELVARDDIYVDRFLREARAAAGLNHPNVVGVYNVGGAGDVYFIEMEYVAGQSLQSLVGTGRGLAFDRATHIAIAVTKALEAAQAKKLVHRDIKPDNILLGNDGSVKVTDFGLAKTVEAATSITQTGSVMGTPYFMSPEQCDGEEADGRSDIYALGATYYYMLTGRLPYVGKTALAIMYKHKHEDVPNILKLHPEFPAMVQDVLAKAMAKKPEDRYQTATESLAALEELADYEVETPPLNDVPYLLTPPAVDLATHTASDPETATHVLLTPRPLWNTVAAAAGILLGLLVLWLVGRRGGSAPARPPQRPAAGRQTGASPAGAGEPAAATQTARVAKPSRPKPRGRPRRLVIGRAGQPARSARTLAVRQDGRGQHESIADALQESGDGTHIVVQDNAAYSQPWPAPRTLRDKKNVHILAAPGRTPEVLLGRESPPLVLGDGWSVSGLRFKAAAGRAAPAVSVTGRAQIDRCFFDGTRQAIAWRSAGLTVRNSVFLGDGAGPMLVVLDAAKQAGLRELTFSHNTVTDWRTVFAAPCARGQNVRAEVEGNIFASAERLIHENPRDFMPWPSFGWRSEGNGFWQIGEYFRQGGSRALVQAKILADWQTIKKADRNSVEADPKFAGKDKHDLRLATGSPFKGKANEGRDLGVPWPDATWSNWLAEHEQALAAQQMQGKYERQVKLAAVRLWLELARLLADRHYDQLAKRCQQARQEGKVPESVSRLGYWQHLAKRAERLVRQSEKGLAQHVGKPYALAIRQGRTGTLRIQPKVLSVDDGVARIEFGQSVKQVPVADLAAESVLALNREPGPLRPEKLLDEAIFLFGDGDEKAARDTLARLTRASPPPKVAQQAKTLQDHWDAVLQAKATIEREEKAATAVASLLERFESGDTRGLDAAVKALEAEYAGTTAFAEAKGRLPAIQLVLAGDAIMERVRPRSAKRYAYAETKRTVERRMGSYRDRQLVVRKQGGQHTSIRAALRQASGRTKIVIADSETYDESLLITKPGIMIRAADGARPTIAPAGGRRYAVTGRAEDLLLYGLRFRGGMGVSLTGADNATVCACEVVGCGQAGRGLGGALEVRRASGVIVLDNTFEYNHGSAIVLEGCPEAVVARNRCVGNAGYGLYAANGVIAVGNLFACNLAGLCHGKPRTSAAVRSSSLVEGNVMWRNLHQGVLSQPWPARTVFRHNVVAANGAGGVAIAQGSGADSALVQNVFCANWDSQLGVSKTALADAMLIRDNVLCGAAQALAPPPTGEQAQPARVVDRNLLFSAARPAWLGDTSVASLEEWRHFTQQGPNSRWAKPALAAPERYDFRLREDAPSLGWGIPANASLFKLWPDYLPCMESPSVLQNALTTIVASRRMAALTGRTTVKVAKSGAGTARTIAAGLAKVSSGGVVEIVDSASYVEQVVLDKRRVALVAGPEAKPVLRAPKDAAFAVAVRAPDVTLVGLKIVGGENGIIVEEAGARALIAKTVVQGASEAGIYVSRAQGVYVGQSMCYRCKDGIAVERGRRIVLLGNRCAHNRGGGIVAIETAAVHAVGNVCNHNAADGLAADASEGVSLVNNLIYSNAGHGLRCRNVGDLFVEHNTVHGNGGAGLHAGPLSAWVRIAGNVLTGNRVGVAASKWQGASPLVVSWNAVHGNTDGYGQWDGQAAKDLAGWQKASQLGQQSTASPVEYQSPKQADLRLRRRTALLKRAPDGQAVGLRWTDRAWESRIAEAAQFTKLR